jgi:cellulose synthase (UDP-forming)
MTLILPSVVYAAVVFPLWHRAPFRLEAWSIRMMYGWAHLFAIWDGMRGRPIEWRATGSSAARDSNRNRRFWIGVVAWGGTTALVWVGAAVWRMSTMVASDFALVLASGLFYALTVGRILVQPDTAGVR